MGNKIFRPLPAESRTRPPQIQRRRRRGRGGDQRPGLRRRRIRRRRPLGRIRALRRRRQPRIIRRSLRRLVRRARRLPAEEEAAPVQDNVHLVPAGGVGEGVLEDTLPGRVYKVRRKIVGLAHC